MIIKPFKVSQNFLITLLMLCVFLPTHSNAQKKRKKKKDNIETAAVAPPKKTKEKTIAELVKSSKEINGLFKLYQDTITGSLQMLIKENQIGKEFIHFGQIAEGLADGGFTIRGAYRGSKIFKVKKYFNKIEFVTQNTSLYFDPNNAISKAKDANISEGNMASLKIEAQDQEKGLYLIKADELFLKETLLQIKPASRPSTPPTAFKLGNLNKDKTKIESIKNYPENVNVKVEYVYSKPSTLNNGSNAVSDGRNVSIKVFHSLIALPDNDYEPRFDDPRVGYWIMKINDQTSTSATPFRDVIHRWHLKKKNPEAEISEPVKPITWWMENTTPLEWRSTIKGAVLEWNKAFEKAGFKNAIVVKQQPDDADWDAGDIRYNVLRWTSSPSPRFGGYGPHLANPRTGETFASDIMLEYNIFRNSDYATKLYGNVDNVFDPYHMEESLNSENYCMLAQGMQANIHFAQTAATVFGASDYDLNEIQKQALKGVVIHEIGHTLGLNHNFKASQLYSPEQLADPKFIEGKCLTASIMDYAITNVTRDRSKQGQYDDVTIGPYDVWAIQLGYKPFKSEADRQALLNESTKPEHIFGNDADDMRSSGKGIDPRAMIFDQSSDPIAYSIDRIGLADDLMKTAKEKFTNNGASFHELRRVYYTLSAQKSIAARVISRYIGGVYVDRAMAGQEGGKQPYTPVSIEEQKRAMNALKTYVFAPDAFNAPNDLFNYLARQRRGFDYTQEDPKIHAQILGYQKNVLNHILHPNTLQRITDSQLYGNKYSLSMMMTDLNNAIFKADIYGNVNTFRQNLQIEYAKNLINLLTGKQKDRFSHNAKSLALYSLKNIRTMAAPSGNIESRAHKHHLRTLIDNALEDI